MKIKQLLQEINQDFIKLFHYNLSNAYCRGLGTEQVKKYCGRRLWHFVFKLTCTEMKMEEFYQKFEQLSYFEAENFDDGLCELVCDSIYARQCAQPWVSNKQNFEFTWKYLTESIPFYAHDVEEGAYFLGVYQLRVNYDGNQYCEGALYLGGLSTDIVVRYNGLNDEIECYSVSNFKTDKLCYKIDAASAMSSWIDVVKEASEGVSLFRRLHNVSSTNNFTPNGYAYFLDWLQFTTSQHDKLQEMLEKAGVSFSEFEYDEDNGDTIEQFNIYFNNVEQQLEVKRIFKELNNEQIK